MSVGPLFDQLEEQKRALTQMRRHRFGPAPADADTWLAQLARIAEDINLPNPFPLPRRQVLLDDQGQDVGISHA